MFSTPRRRRIGWAVLYLCVAVFIFGIVGVLVRINALAESVRDTQLEGTPTGKKLVASADRILDCTDAEGECAKRNQERTAKAVADLTGNLTRVVVLASACSSNLSDRLSVRQREVAIQSCIIDRLAQEKPPE